MHGPRSFGNKQTAPCGKYPYPWNSGPLARPTRPPRRAGLVVARLRQDSFGLKLVAKRIDKGFWIERL
jgi:hypothetical protein